MEIVASTLVQNAVQTGPTTAASPTAAPDVRATERFAELMQAGKVDTPPIQTAVPGAPSETPPTVNPSLGDRILTGLQNVSSDFQQSWKNVATVLEGGQSMSAADMLKLQVNLTQMSIQYDLVGKVISRSTQNVEQLVKIQ